MGGLPLVAGLWAGTLTHAGEAEPRRKTDVHGWAWGRPAVTDSPAVGEGLVFAADLDGRIYAFTQ